MDLPQAVMRFARVFGYVVTASGQVGLSGGQPECGTAREMVLGGHLLDSGSPSPPTSSMEMERVVVF